MPTGPMLLRETLRTGGVQTCQRLLSLCQIRKARAGGGVLDVRQRAVDFERLGEVFGANGPDLVAGDATNGKDTKVSAAADTCQIRQGRAGGAPQLLEHGVDLERLGEVFGANGSDFVVGDAANGKGTEVSVAADTSGEGREAAYSMEVSVPFVLSASAKAAGPCGVEMNSPWCL